MSMVEGVFLLLAISMMLYGLIALPLGVIGLVGTLRDVSIHSDVNSGRGTVNALLKDSTMVNKLNTSLDNILKGTDGFNQNMEALKHNFLLRGYFKKQGKQKQKEEVKSTVKDE